MDDKRQRTFKVFVVEDGKRSALITNFVRWGATFVTVKVDDHVEAMYPWHVIEKIVIEYEPEPRVDKSY